MTRALLLAALAAPLMLAGAVHAQSMAQSAPRPLPPGPSTWDQHRYQADQHRYEMDRLRQQNDRREAATRQLQLEGRQTRLELDQQRTTAPSTAPLPPVRSVEEQRAAREAATRRRETTADRVGEIDAWLDRRPN
ncbi:hypothetical protein [Brevundimonas sp. GCM10030266]|uniref:hypothetical protein n=1 Tax=Brevundimonas sp. GCM10030266 TaxID=3273386 RepID=UPI0036082075